MIPDSANAGDWYIYRGTGVPGDAIDRLPAPPSWRRFDAEPATRADDDVIARADTGAAERGTRYIPTVETVEAVNAALYLRRPLLVTGKPGTGKSTLAHSIAHELRLGRVLNWPINSRSTLLDGLYAYDAIGRLQDANLAQLDAANERRTLGDYLTLGPLGTALAGRARPRVLLIDEIDKSDTDLPNDLLNVFEEGEFTVPELRRVQGDGDSTVVHTADPGGRTVVRDGLVRCSAFPMVVITSNGEREFPAPFLRRCIRLDVPPPGEDDLTAILSAHLGPEAVRSSEGLIRRFLTRRDAGDLATDQLMNAIYLVTAGGVPTAGDQRDRLTELVLRRLNPEY